MSEKLLRVIKPFFIFGLVWTVLVLSPVVLILLVVRTSGNANGGLEIAKLLYSWPVATSIVLIYFLVRYHDSVSSLIVNLARLKFGKLEIETAQKGLPQTLKDPRKGEITWEEWLLDLGRKLTPTDVEVIKTLGSQQQQILLAWIKSWWFEKIWGLIYQTQISFLEHGVRKATPITLPEAMVFYNEHVRLLTASNPDYARRLESPEEREVYFASFLGFLESTYLIQKTATEMVMTQLAGEFLGYLAGQNYAKQMRVW